MNQTRILTVMAVFIAIGVVGSQFLWFPAGIAKAYPAQHAVNVMAGIMLGPGPAIGIAFVIGLLRNLLGIGSLLAFPGGMVGAFMAGYFYKKFKKHHWAPIGEVLGTGVIASLLSAPFAKLLMGSSFGVLFFMPSFLVSSMSGSIIGWLVISRVKQASQFLHVKI